MGSNPSKNRLKPTINKNARASILRVGCLCMKLAILSEKKNMMIMAMITAVIMTGTRRARPTAVMMLSNENTMSMIMIWAITAPNEAFLGLLSYMLSSPSSLLWISFTVL